MTARSASQRLSKPTTNWANFGIIAGADHWYGPFLTRLALAIGDEKLEYLTSAIDGQDFHGRDATVRVAIFTEAHVIVASHEDGQSESLQIDPRSFLSRIRLTDGATVFDGRAEGDISAGNVKVALQYPSGHNLTLPHGYPGAAAISCLVDFLPTLKDDLLR